MQLLKKYSIQSTSLGEIRKVIKGSFEDILQDALEVELDGHLEYEKDQASESLNSRNRYSLKTTKRIFGTINLKLPRDGIIVLIFFDKSFILFFLVKILNVLDI